MAAQSENESAPTSHADDDKGYLDYLTAAQIEQEELLNIVYESELSSPVRMEPLLTESEICALFDCGYSVDMIAKTYPEFGMDKIKQFKRKWSDKKHKKKKKKNASNVSIDASDESVINKNAHKMKNRSFRTSAKHKKKRKSRRKSA